ncbi:hypothetical protein RSOLAG22IIIB_05111 [Rhizoctonia solani]|uniref:MYND-type domain-containing protein n=1 Tax=Rhizoctonia solani TaxID=456999 RepID=A0A0K6G387_9AGAM|nr:hypothetical protein RSOLAG22IIIB_05111 [Rhizoctonia solani]
MALGICIVEKFGEQHLDGFMKCVWTEYPTKDNPSILTEYLVQIVLNETSTWSPRESRCGWIFGWSDPPAHGGHSRLVVAESDALELMNILGDDRKMFFKALLSAYTPGALIILLLIWQRMLRNGLQRDFSGPPSRVPFLEQFLDLSWRFALAARPSDYGFVFTTGISAMFHLGKLAASPVDVEDSRAIIRAYIQGIPIIEDTVVYRHSALGLYPHIPHFIIRNILPGTDDLFPGLIKTILARMWEMVLWEGLEHLFTPPAIVASGFEDLLLFLHIHAADSSVIQIVLEELANEDILGLIGFAVHRLDPTRQSTESMMHHDPTSCAEFKNIILSMLATLSQACAACTIPYYFIDYEMEWVKHLQHNDILLLMADNSQNAKSCAEFRREVLWDVIKKISPEDTIKKILGMLSRLSCSYERCPAPSLVEYAQLWCSLCMTAPKGANYCSSRCQILDWGDKGEMSHRRLCPRSD